jgi:hypothetical protein
MIRAHQSRSSPAKVYLSSNGTAAKSSALLPTLFAVANALARPNAGGSVT